MYLYVQSHKILNIFKFSRLFSIFQKWTKINVQNQNSEKTFGKKIKKNCKKYETIKNFSVSSLKKNFQNCYEKIF
jgi:hypothetical protein